MKEIKRYTVNHDDAREQPHPIPADIEFDSHDTYYLASEADEAIAALRAELAKANAGWGEAFRLCVHHQDRANKAETELNSLKKSKSAREWLLLREENERLGRDAQRYRYIRSDLLGLTLKHELLFGEDLDRELDAEMAALEGK